MDNGIIEGYQLSPQQRRVWLSGSGLSVPCHAKCAILVEGPVAVRALEDAIRSVARRHEILRTTFRTVPGMEIPLQVIDDESAVVVEASDLTGLDDRAQRERLDALLADLGSRGFDPDRGPLTRVVIAALAADRLALLLCVSALVSDPTGLRRLVREIARACDGEPDDGGTQARRSSMPTSRSGRTGSSRGRRRMPGDCTGARGRCLESNRGLRSSC